MLLERIWLAATPAWWVLKLRRTYLEDPRLEAFGRVVKGYGNNGQDGSEGIKYKPHRHHLARPIIAQTRL